MPPITEHVERSAFWIFPQLLGDGSEKAVKTFAHVTRVNRHEHFEAARKTQHGFSRARINATTSAT